MQPAKEKVLFLCTGNSARSQIAEAWLRHHAGERYEAHSAGITPKGIHPFTIQVMAEKGIALDGHTSDDVRKYLGHINFGTVITVCAHAEENCPRAWLLSNQHLHWQFDDPAVDVGTAAEQLARFRRVRDEIEQQIVNWLQPMVVAA